VRDPAERRAALTGSARAALWIGLVVVTAHDLAYAWLSGRQRVLLLSARSVAVPTCPLGATARQRSFAPLRLMKILSSPGATPAAGVLLVVLQRRARRRAALGHGQRAVAWRAGVRERARRRADLACA
jgi:hypothetical protein